MKKRLGAALGGLYARLIVSYVLVTLVTMGALILFVGIGQYIQTARQPPSNQEPVAQVLKTQTMLLARYLDHASPDIPELQTRLTPLLLDPLFNSANRAVYFVGIWEPDGQIVASADCGLLSRGPKFCALPAPTTTLGVLTAPSIQTALRSVLSGNVQSAEVARVMPNGDSFLALPVVGPNRTILGAVGAIAGERMSGTDTSPGGFISEYLVRLENNNWPYFLLLAMVIGTLAGMYISRDLRRRLRRITRAAEAWSQGELAVAVRDPASDELGQLARDLDHMAERLQTLLASREELAVVEERNRLARELHDTVKQHVFAGALLVRAARKLLSSEPEKARSYLTEAETLAGDTQQELIALIAALRPAAIADKGLVAVLRDEIDDWSRRTGLAAELRTQGERMTPLDVEEALLRVAQEALTNVARHSGARRVVVRLDWDEQCVCVTIQDDGYGFDPAQASRGVGLASMRERTEALGGMLTITSVPGATSIEACVSIPITPALMPGILDTSEAEVTR
jgi:signal transduction histidine kinase